MFPSFSPQLDSDFSSTLRKRVNEYFTINHIRRTGNRGLIFKACCMLMIYFGPWIIILTGTITSPWLFMLMWGLMGIGIAGIGMSITHDANHGTFSRNKKINRLAAYSMNVIGATPFLWKIQHNLLHHGFTNIHGYDTDIKTPFILRFSPNEPRHWYHRFQHLYIWIFYSVATLSWMTIKEFIQIVNFYRQGHIATVKKFIIELVKLILWKAIYYTYILVIPILVLPMDPLWILGGFLFMHFIAGIIISLVFQTAHVMPEASFPVTDHQMTVKNNWVLHQMATTCNYAPGNRFFTWFTGGLNYQIEHHLFTGISHIHYRDISHIVVETAEEYGIAYHQHGSFLGAIRTHLKMLKMLGKGNTI